MKSRLVVTAAICAFLCRLSLGATLFAGFVPTQAWTALQPATHPRAVTGSSIVYDAARSVTVLFGGFNYHGTSAGQYRNETWSWNGIDWTHLQPGVVPPARVGAGMCYDSVRQRVVLFGGNGDGNQYLADTWEWDGVTWSPITPLNSPSARFFAMVAFDEARGNTVLFGGAGANGKLGDTWTWDGSDWTVLAPAHSPEALASGAMAYDGGRARCVMFGGYDSNLQLLGSTWEWDGTDWALRSTAHAPSPRVLPALAYDPLNQRIVMFGGAYVNRFDQTWEYDGHDWSLANPVAAPPARSSAACAYDAARANIVIFAGDNGFMEFGDTWVYTHVGTPAAFETLGQGCVGSHGTPQLAVAERLPVIGTSFVVACTRLQPDHFTTMWIGFSKTFWSRGPLPYDLGPLGMPGCTLFVSADSVTAMLNWNGSAYWRLGIPNAPQLIGMSFYLQAGVIDHVNALGMVVTNAGEARIGDL